MSTHLDSVIQRLIGLPIEQAQLGHGSFLTFDLGKPLKGEQERREWHVWIYCCYWEMFRNESSVTHCEDNRLSISNSVESLAGRLFSKIAVGIDGGSEFQFSDGTSIRTFPWEEEAESWMIYTPEGIVLTLNSDGTWDYVRGDKSIDHPLKQPLAQPRQTGG